MFVPTETKGLYRYDSKMGNWRQFSGDPSIIVNDYYAIDTTDSTVYDIVDRKDGRHTVANPELTVILRQITEK